ncbi:hypothetical protein [Streptomyces olivaceiscleroticus]|uniref:ATP-binding protein n=1 Tax=Streptomyces olivaceiscleroticus TaxID=68245 RepID=A0ABP3LF92_9ACTN
MSDSIGTWIGDPNGPVHSGNGDQYIYISGGVQPHTHGRPTYRQRADDQLRWVQQVLVPPSGMGAARGRLCDTGTVILDGPRGSGRTAAAQVLLREYRRSPGSYRELLLDEEDGELSLRDPASVGAGDQLLLDLSDVDDTRWAAARADLSALRKAVHDQQAHLVVVMPHGAALDLDLQNYRVEIGRPPGLDVFRRHLRAHGVPYEQYLREERIVTDFRCEDRPMEEIAKFADLVRRARETARSGGSFADWCATALKAWGGRREEIAKFVVGMRESPQRALLLTVAMLHDAHADVIHHTAELLLRTLGSPRDDLPLLQRQDLAERLTGISAKRHPDGHVRFTALDYDAAVRTHFWDHMPALRPYLGTWVARSTELDDPHLTPELRNLLVSRLAGEYLRTGRWDGLAALAKDWSAQSASRPRLEAAVHALTCGLRESAHAGRFRRQIYEWCAYKQLEGNFAQVLVQVCAAVIAPSHPDQALVRLHHLARRTYGSTRALQALCDLVATDSRLRRQLLGRLARRAPSPTDLHIFLHACDPVPLIEPYGNSRALVDESDVQESLTNCWRAVLTGLSRTDWQPRVERWLHTATGAGHRGALLLDVLVGAAGRCEANRGATFAALYASARAAEPTTPGGRARGIATTDLLLQKISEAQGLARPASSRGTKP